MPMEACQFFYECKSYGTVLKPNPSDCCVFGSVKCPDPGAKVMLRLVVAPAICSIELTFLPREKSTIDPAKTST
jgi:hypothetical protein